MEKDLLTENEVIEAVLKTNNSPTEKSITKKQAHKNELAE